MSAQSDRRHDAQGPVDQPPGMPRWVQASLIAAVVVAVVVVVVMLLSGGEHGPARHVGVGLPADVAALVRA